MDFFLITIFYVVAVEGDAPVQMLAYKSFESFGHSMSIWKRAWKLDGQILWFTSSMHFSGIVVFWNYKMIQIFLPCKKTLVLIFSTTVFHAEQDALVQMRVYINSSSLGHSVNLDKSLGTSDDTWKVYEWNELKIDIPWFTLHGPLWPEWTSTHPQTHHHGWMVCGQDTFCHWVLGPQLTSLQPGVLKFRFL